MYGTVFMPNEKDRFYQLGYVTDLLASEVTNIQRLIQLMNLKIDKCPGCPGPPIQFVNDVAQKIANLTTQATEINQTIVTNSVKSAVTMQ